MRLLTSISFPFWPISCPPLFHVLCVGPVLPPLSVLPHHLLVPLHPPCLPPGEALHPRCLGQCRAAAAGGPPAPYRHLHPPPLPGECSVSMVSGGFPSALPHQAPSLMYFNVCSSLCGSPTLVIFGINLLVNKILFTEKGTSNFSHLKPNTYPPPSTLCTSVTILLIFPLSGWYHVTQDPGQRSPSPLPPFPSALISAEAQSVLTLNTL